jgi:hypothetical protein
MEPHQSGAKLISCSGSLALAWILPCWACANDVGSESVPPPAVVISARLHLREGCSLAYSRDGLTLAVGLATEVKLYDPRTNQERVTLAANGKRCFETLAFSPDGRTLATAGPDGAWLWDFVAGDRRQIATKPVYCLKYSADGQYLAMGTHGDSDDAAPCEIRLWDTEARQVGAVFRGIISRVRSMAFAPDGRALAAACREGVFVWDLPIPSPERPTISAGPTGARSRAHDSDYLGTGTGKKSSRSTLGEDGLPWLVVIGASYLGVLFLACGWWRCSLAYRARKECRSLLKSWVEGDGMRLFQGQVCLIPFIYRLTVEDQPGVERRGWAIISGKVATVFADNVATTQEFIPLKVRYLGLWPVARPAPSPKVGASIALWDDWVDRQT